VNGLVFEPDFTLALIAGDRGPVMAVGGELDSGTCEELATTLRQALEPPGVGEVTLDLSGVSFIDSAGTRAVIMLEREARERGISLVIVAPPNEVTELLRTAGIIDRFQLRPTSASAAVTSSSPLERVELELPRASQSPARARAEVRELLAGHDQTQVADIVLLTSEIVTNAVIHPPAGAEGDVGLRILTHRDGVRVEVDDHGGGFDPGAPSRSQPDRGRGLFLVDRFSSRWGTDHVRDDRGPRFRVWFELDWHRHRNAETHA
jgi:anti-anti-sigma factor